jgi:glycosidase
MKGYNFGRDPERSPMQWNKNDFAGFSNAEPWLPVEKDYTDKNVFSESKDPTSFLNLYKKIIHVRRKSQALSFGKYVPLNFDNEHIFGFIREFENEKVLILVNFSEKEQLVTLPKEQWKILLSTYMDTHHIIRKNQIHLRPSESFIFTS